MKKTDKMIGLFLIILGVAIIIPLFVMGGSGGDWGEEKHHMTCSVTLKNPVWPINYGDVKIEQVSCQMGKKCYFSLSMNELGIITDEGTVYLRAVDGTYDKKRYSLTETESETFSLDICTTSTSGIIEVQDKDGNVLDTAEVSI